MASRKKKELIELNIIDIIDKNNVDVETQWDFTILSQFKDSYPKKTNILCWWCCHSFDSQPLGIPKNYNQHDGSFSALGCFCSISCVYAYVLNNKSHEKCTKSDILFMYKKLTGRTDSFLINNVSKFKSAPPRQVLKAFGGNMTIEQYRSINSEYNVEVLSYPLIPIYMTCQTLQYNKPLLYLKKSVSGISSVKDSASDLLKTRKEVNPDKSKKNRTVCQLVSFVD